MRYRAYPGERQGASKMANRKEADLISGAAASRRRYFEFRVSSFEFRVSRSEFRGARSEERGARSEERGAKGKTGFLFAFRNSLLVTRN